MDRPGYFVPLRYGKLNGFFVMALIIPLNFSTGEGLIEKQLLKKAVYAYGKRVIFYSFLRFLQSRQLF